MTDDPPLRPDPVAAAFARLTAAMRGGSSQEERRPPAKWLGRAVWGVIGAGVLLLMLISIYAALWP
jgi:hypothetical protein